MEVKMPIHFDSFGHYTALEIVRVIPAPANGEVSVRGINCSNEGGVAAETHARVGGQSVIVEGLGVSLVIDLSKGCAGAANVNRQACVRSNDDLRGRGSVPLHEDITRNIQHSVAIDVHDVFRLQRKTGHQIIVTA